MQIEDVARAQAGAFTRAQALAAGLSARQIDRRVQRGDWCRLLPRIYVHRAAPVTTRTRVWAGLLYVGSAGVASHLSAAWLLGLIEPPSAIHLTIPRSRRLILPTPYVIYRRPLLSSEMTTANGLRVTQRLRTVTDCLRVLERRPAMTLLDAAFQRRWVTPADVRSELDRASGFAGNDRARDVVAAVDRSMSVAERRLRQILRLAGMTGWIANYAVTRGDASVIALVDVAFPAMRLAIEVDGMAFHTDPAAFQRERMRQNALVAEGWTVLRFTWWDITERPQYVVKQVHLMLERLAAA